MTIGKKKLMLAVGATAALMLALAYTSLSSVTNWGTELGTVARVEAKKLQRIDGKSKLDRVATAVRSITESADKVNMLVEEVEFGSEEQSRGIEEVAKAITQIEKVSQTTANAEQGASTCEELARHPIPSARSCFDQMGNRRWTGTAVAVSAPAKVVSFRSTTTSKNSRVPGLPEPALVSQHETQVT
jgi:hypothetical protein